MEAFGLIFNTSSGHTDDDLAKCHLSCQSTSCCLQLTAEVPSIYYMCYSSGHLVNLLLGALLVYTSGLSLATDLGPVLAWFVVQLPVN